MIIAVCSECRTPYRNADGKEVPACQCGRHTWPEYIRDREFGATTLAQQALAMYAGIDIDLEDVRHIAMHAFHEQSVITTLTAVAAYLESMDRYFQHKVAQKND